MIEINKLLKTSKLNWFIRMAFVVTIVSGIYIGVGVISGNSPGSLPQKIDSAGVRGHPDKTNFWMYAQKLFNLSEPLTPNIGLTGKSLSINHHPYPFQKALIRVRMDGNTSEVLAESTVVAPVSSELVCINCHSDTGDATTRYPISPTGKVETNILTLHDYLNMSNYPAGHTGPLMDRRPILCAECHSSNALNAPGVPGISSLSNAMHRHHKDLPDITPDTDGCYNCHPGQKTKCLRDTMSQNFALNCTTCHGTMEFVSQNPEPWHVWRCYLPWRELQARSAVIPFV